MSDKALARKMELPLRLNGLGADLVPIHVIGPASDDVAYLESVEKDGLLAARCTALALNEGMVPMGRSSHAVFSEGVLDEGRETAGAEANRFRAGCRSTEAETVTSLSRGLADASARAFAGRVQAIDRRTAALVALGMVAAFITIGVDGW